MISGSGVHFFEGELQDIPIEDTGLAIFSILSLGDQREASSQLLEVRNARRDTFVIPSLVEVVHITLQPYGSQAAGTIATVYCPFPDRDFKRVTLEVRETPIPKFPVSTAAHVALNAQ